MTSKARPKNRSTAYVLLQNYVQANAAGRRRQSVKAALASDKSQGSTAQINPCAVLP